MKCYNDSVEKYKIIKHHDNDISIDLAYALNSKGYFIILYSLKKYDKIAIECFDESLEYYPKFAYPWYNKGFILCKEKKYKEAIECLDRSISLDRNFAYAWLNKAYALNGFGKYTEGLACFDKAIDLLYKNEKADDSLANAWYNKGYALSSLKRYKEAIECFDNTIDICKSLKHYNNSKEMDSELAYALYNKGYALNCLGEHEEAIKSFNDSLEIKNFKEHVAYLRIGQSKYEIGNYTGALHDFQNIKDPSLVDEKHYYMGLCYHKQDSFKQAEEEYNEAIKSKSGYRLTTI